ncbi:hypothetical protein ACFWUU_40420 [Kribbella sp. NPDC058693]|uniref:hypothetical protein n=1 Tax=Kribbella sp. NPDC058693 TaxID=3346602 RepID=UPI00365CC788
MEQPELEKRIEDLIHESDRLLNYDAEVLEDADNPAGAQRARERSAEAYREAVALAKEHGLDWFDNDEDEDGDEDLDDDADVQEWPR